jgi:hypothetical protein
MYELVLKRGLGVVVIGMSSILIIFGRSKGD